MIRIESIQYTVRLNEISRLNSNSRRRNWKRGSLIHPLEFSFIVIS